MAVPKGEVFLGLNGELKPIVVPSLLNHTLPSDPVLQARAPPAMDHFVLRELSRAFSVRRSSFRRFYQKMDKSALISANTTRPWAALCGGPGLRQLRRLL